MACYISSNDNRFYAAVEASYGKVPAITAGNYFSGIKLSAKQRAQPVDRRDKTGTRSFVGLPARLRRETSFEVKSYLSAWTNPAQAPPLDPFLQGALGGAPLSFAGGILAGNSDSRTLRFAAAHNLASGQAVTFGGEIRFVATVINTTSVQLNAPLTILPSAGSPIGPAVTYPPATALRGVSVFDYWGPANAVQRIVSGAAVDEMRVKINGDFHELRFKGPARDIVDSASFESGLGGLTSYPTEPTPGDLDYSIVPGNLGQVWLGTNPDQFYTITEGEVVLANDIETRNRDFGSDLPFCIVPGQRSVTVNFALYEQGANQTKELYQAARQRSPISVMLQLGEQPGQMMGIYLKSVVPEVPEYDDSERRLQWRFTDSRAQGTFNDEIMIAFG
ncbi:MAG: hypothetical protein ABI693_20730 [Bryobacteraceae bacterium]